MPLRLPKGSPDALFERLEEARGEVAREVWIRGAIELRLDGRITAPVRRVSRTVRSSAEVRRDVRPLPKDGKKK